MSVNQLSMRIFGLRRALRRAFETSVAHHEITGTQFQVLRRLWNSDGLNAQTLARDAHLDAATMTGVLDRLESKGLVRRERDKNDRRAVQIFLCEGGRALEDPLMAALGEVNATALAGLSTAERTQLFDLLDRVAHNLEMPPIEGNHGTDASGNTQS